MIPACHSAYKVSSPSRQATHPAEVWHELDTQTHLLHPSRSIMSCKWSKTVLCSLFKLDLELFPTSCTETTSQPAFHNYQLVTSVQIKFFRLAEKHENQLQQDWLWKKYYVNACMRYKRFKRIFSTKSKSRKTFLGKERNFKSLFQKTNIQSGILSLACAFLFSSFLKLQNTWLK